MGRYLLKLKEGEMRIHITHDRRGKPIVDIDGHEGDAVEDMVEIYKKLTKQLLAKSDEDELAQQGK